jgi:hypothetical protein
MKHFSKGVGAERIRSTRGLSVVEVMVAFSVIALVAFASASFFNQQRSLLNNFTPNGECKAVLEAQMNYIRQEGMAPTGLPWKDPSLAISDPSRYPDPWLPTPLRYGSSSAAQVPLVTATAGNNTLVSNYTLQRGAMGLLNSLYNRVPGICQNGVDPKNLSTSLALTPDFDGLSLSTFSSTLKIEPFQLTSGNAAGCLPTPLWVRPRGLFEFPDANRPFQFAPEIKADYGFRVSLNAKYTDRTNLEKSCSLTEDFSYPVDHGVQSISVIWSTTVSSSGEMSPPEADSLNAPRPQCSHTPGKPAGLTLKIGFNTTAGQPIETGTVFMCRDISEQMNPNFCERWAGDNTAGVGAVMEGVNYNVGNAQNPVTDPLTKKWVPCSQVTACGISPTTFTTQENPAVPGSVTYLLNYQNNTSTSKDGLWGCDVRIDVASVDLAGNFRKLSTEGSPAPGVAMTDSRHYFQPTDCYTCYKKKKRSWGSFVISTIIIGPFISCLAGVGGVCRPKSTTYKGYSCTNNLPGADFCVKVPPKRPAWFRERSPLCPDKVVALPAAYGGQAITIPGGPSGTTYDTPVLLNDQAAFCDVQAICESGTWMGVPDEYNGRAPFVECSKVWTRHKIDISTAPAGQPAPAGAPECVFTVPDSATMSMFDASIYNGMDVCSPALTGKPTNLICNVTTGSNGEAIISYPVNAVTGDPDNTNPNQYYYFKRIIPTPTQLPGCTGP